MTRAASVPTSVKEPNTIMNKQSLMITRRIPDRGGSANRSLSRSACLVGGLGDARA
jgi:hypothetical protein